MTVDRAEFVQRLIAQKVRHQEQLDGVLEAVEANLAMIRTLQEQIDKLSLRIKNELAENE